MAEAMRSSRGVPLDVHDYDPDWARKFDALRCMLWPLASDVALSIEHVGSTAVPGLAAKPIIDIDIVAAPDRIPTIIARLETVAYVHIGDMGVPGREAFRISADTPAHNLYVCVEGCASLRNHLALRDYLRSHPDAARAYGGLKKQLAEAFPNDIDRYVAGKAEMIAGCLTAAGMQPDEVAAIFQLNTDVA
jgi:GrpB-like predicted nucleotidyltransferase (UPF0157 family)